jgi:hypothetical protein
MGLAVSASGQIYVADALNNRIAVGTPISGPYLTVTEKLAGSQLRNGDTVDHGTVFLGDSHARVLTLTNQGDQDLVISKSTHEMLIDGANAGDFRVSNGPPYSGPGWINAPLITLGPWTLHPGESTSIYTTFTARDRRAREAKLHIPTNDPVSPSFDIRLTGTGTPLGEVYVERITSTDALLRSWVDRTCAGGSAYYEYGTTSFYGGQTRSIALQPDSPYSLIRAPQNLEGLTANTTYHFRLVVTDSTGTYRSEDQTFRTLQSSPPGWHYVTLSQTGNAALGGRRTALPSTTYRFLHYYKGTDDNLWALHYGNGAWHQTALTSGANVDDWFTESPRHNQIYYKGKDNHISAAWYSGDRWHNAAITDIPNAAGDLCTDTGTNFIYYRGDDGNLWVTWFAQGKWNQAALTGSANVAGNVAVDSSTHYAYYRGTDSNLWVVWFAAGKWNEAPVTKLADVAADVVVDPGWGAYYKNSLGEKWAVWFDGKQWAQSSIWSYGNTDGAVSLFTHLGLLYVGWEGSAWYLAHDHSGWHDALVGGSNLRDTLNYSPGDGLIYGKTADGHLGVFYYQ